MYDVPALAPFPPVMPAVHAGFSAVVTAAAYSEKIRSKL